MQKEVLLREVPVTFMDALGLEVFDRDPNLDACDPAREFNRLAKAVAHASATEGPPDLVTGLILRFKDTVCRHRDTLVGAERTSAIVCFRRQLERINPIHEYLFLDEQTLIDRICPHV